ncbi:MAG: hypothetical protein K8R54_18230 [Bacteroidales bacterium]|nr:hypothetical protein [Bacteroidales bacterium]
MYELTKKEKKTLKNISKIYYMQPALNMIDVIISKSKDKKDKWKDIFNMLYEILINTKDKVDKLLEKRKKDGEIRDISQARKSIAGNAFSNLVVYTFLQNKLQENIKSKVFITSKKSEIKDFNKIATIKVGDETQKPDVDLIIYTEKDNETVDKCIILSLKTSLRERAGQTYKWKLLMEIATTDNPIKEKYGIEYNPDFMPLVCFATVNFYNEINNPQHRGMFKFFDNSFIGKPINNDFINSLSHLIDYVNKTL